MNIYKKLGIRTMINASDVYTSIGGSCMSREVLEAMKDAAKYFVDIEELQKKAGERIALLTHNEAAYVSAGAGAGVVLVAAACITGNDPVLVERLPDTSSMKNEIIVIEQHCKNNPYPHLIEMSGAKLVKVRASTNDIEDAINKNTAAMFYFDGVIGSKTGITVEEFVRIGKLYNIPVIVDAAAQLPPVENLWYYTKKAGADIAIFSGGKHIAGPQTTGLVLGKKEIIEACRLNGNPNCNIGRPYKVGKEETIAFLYALESFMNTDYKDLLKRYNSYLDMIERSIADIPCIKLSRRDYGPLGQGYPLLLIEIPPEMNANDIRNAIRNGEPSVDIGWLYLYRNDAEKTMFVSPISLREDEVEQVAVAIKKYFKQERGL